MQAVGPEGLLLSARLAELRAIKVHDDLGLTEPEPTEEFPLYLEASVRAQMGEFLGPGRYSRRPGIWMRLRDAITPRRGRPAPAPSISAAPISTLPGVRGEAGYAQAGVPLASLPIRLSQRR